MKRHVRFTTVPLNTLTDQECMRYPPSLNKNYFSMWLAHFSFRNIWGNFQNLTTISSTVLTKTRFKWYRRNSGMLLFFVLSGGSLELTAMQSERLSLKIQDENLFKNGWQSWRFLFNLILENCRTIKLVLLPMKERQDYIVSKMKCLKCDFVDSNIDSLVFTLNTKS